MATITRNGQMETFRYAIGTNAVLVENIETNRPHARNIVNLRTGELTLLFPHNRSFVRLQPLPQNQSATASGFPEMPAIPMPAGAGPGAPAPAPASVAISPTNFPGMPAMPQMPQMPQMPSGVGPQAQTPTMPTIPNMSAGMGAAMAPGISAMPMMPPMMMEKVELKATTDTTNLLGYPCTRYELKQRGEVMEIWATDKLLPFQSYLQNQPPRFGPRMIEEQWGELLKAKKLFPLLAVLRFEMPVAHGATNQPAPGPERLRFEVKAVTPEKITDATLFQLPPDYQEIQPLPF